MEIPNIDPQQEIEIMKVHTNGFLGCLIIKYFSDQTPHSRLKKINCSLLKTETLATKIQFSKNSTHYITILKK